MNQKEKPGNRIIPSLLIFVIVVFALYAIGDNIGLLNSKQNEIPTPTTYQTIERNTKTPISQSQAKEKKRLSQSDEGLSKIKAQLKPDKLIGVWQEAPNQLIVIYTLGNQYYYSNSTASKLEMSEGSKLIVEQKNGRTVYILDMFLNPTNLQPGVKLVNDYTDYHYIDNHGSLVIADKEGVFERYKRVY
jgi:hypothetical protein